jgi:hypothetical protein
LFRRSYDFAEKSTRVSIPASDLNDLVQVNGFIRATVDIPGYKIAGAHEDYDDASFDISTGDILAIGEGQVFDAENVYDSLHRVGSIMVIEESQKSGEHAMEVDYNADKIRIFLCKSDFKAYSKLKLIPNLTRHLTTTLVLPVLIEALHYIEDAADGLAGYKWYRVLDHRVNVLNVAGEPDALAKAQGLLELPIRRALAAAETYVTSASA